MVYFITWRCKKGKSLNAEERTLTMNALRFWDEQKWKLFAAVVLPDHVHVLAQPLRKDPAAGAFALAEIIHSIKSFSAQRIGQLRKLPGIIWQDERYDRIVRDETEFLEKWQYIRNNPLKSGLADSAEEYPWLYERGG